MDTHFNFASTGEYNIVHKMVGADILFPPPIAQTIKQLVTENDDFDADRCLSHGVAIVSRKIPTTEVSNIEARDSSATMR